MTHLEQNFPVELAENRKITFPNQNIIRRFPKIIGKLWYFWSLSVLAFYFLFLMPPIMLACQIFRNRDIAYPFARFGAWSWIWLSGVRVIVRGAENLAPEKSYIFVSNHRSYLDTAAMFAYTGKKMGVIAKKEMLKLPVAGAFMAYVNVIAIDRTNPQRAIETMRSTTKLIKNGVSFGVYAEGTRAMPGELLPFKKGAFYLALDTQTEIVPVVVKNTDSLMGKKTGFAQPGTMEFVMLPPISTEGLTAENDLNILRDKVRTVIAAELARDSKTV